MDHKKIAYRLLDLQGEIIKLINIDRVISLPEDSTHPYENDAEHSYSLAMLAWYLCGHLPELDKDKVIRYALAHDMVEVHAGDVMAIGRTKEEQAAKDAREVKAVELLKDEWSDFEDMLTAIDAYQDQTDDEAVFVRTLDKLVSMIVLICSSGKIWRELDQERKELLENRDAKTKPHKDIHAICKVLRQHIIEHDEYFNEGKAK